MIVSNSEISEVLDIRTGNFYQASNYLDQREMNKHQLRDHLKLLEEKDDKWLVCAIYLVPVYVSGAPEGLFLTKTASLKNFGGRAILKHIWRGCDVSD